MILKTHYYTMPYGLKNMLKSLVFFSDQRMCLWNLELISQISQTFLRELFVTDVLKKMYIFII